MHSTFLSRHGIHLLSVGIPLLMLAIGLTWDAVNKWRRAGGPSRRVSAGPALYVLVVAAVGAGAVHVAVVPEHAREWVGYAAFFAATALFQVAGAVVLLTRRTRLLCALFALGNAALIVLWLVSRFVAVPLGPGAGEVEPVGALDLFASACEAVVVAAAAGCLARRPQRSIASSPTPAVAISAAHG